MMKYIERTLQVKRIHRSGSPVSAQRFTVATPLIVAVLLSGCFFKLLRTGTVMPHIGTLTVAGQTVTITQSDTASAAPFISATLVSGKPLFIYGDNFTDNFIDGATLFINWQKQKKTVNDEANSRTTLVAKKAVKSIASGMTAGLEVEKPYGSRSTTYFLTRL